MNPEVQKFLDEMEELTKKQVQQKRKLQELKDRERKEPEVKLPPEVFR